MKNHLFSKYYKRIFLWITIAIIVCVTAFFVAVYINAGNSVEKMQYDNTQKVFDQITNSFDNMNSLLKNISSILYANNDIINIMYNPNVENDNAAFCKDYTGI
jgi:predicted PurR-regulated permease PerM